MLTVNVGQDQRPDRGPQGFERRPGEVPRLLDEDRGQLRRQANMSHRHRAFAPAHDAILGGAESNMAANSRAGQPAHPKDLIDVARW
jgi:hypothetical protein